MQEGDDWDFSYQVLQYFYASYDAENLRVGLIPMYTNAFNQDSSDSCQQYTYSDEVWALTDEPTAASANPGLLAASIIIPILILAAIIFAIFFYRRHQKKKQMMAVATDSYFAQ